MEVEAAFLEQPALGVQKIPQHVAIIMDGNRRWAKNQGLPSLVGHWRGAEVLSEIVEVAALMGVKALTVYAFSTENWGRTVDEVNSIMTLLQVYLIGQKERMVREGVRLGTIGELGQLPSEVQKVLREVKEATAGGGKIDLTLALNYGGRRDICRATTSIVKECLEGRLRKEDITEDLFSRYLDTAPWGDPELLIRTSGEKRLSNFLLWEIAYTEMYTTPVLWPDFTGQEFEKAIEEFQKREQRIGC